MNQHVTELENRKSMYVCTGCGCDLDTKDANIEGIVRIIPCSSCLDSSYDDGVDDGKDEGWYDGYAEAKEEAEDS